MSDPILIVTILGLALSVGSSIFFVLRFQLELQSWPRILTKHLANGPLMILALLNGAPAVISAALAGFVAVDIFFVRGASLRSKLTGVVIAIGATVALAVGYSGLWDGLDHAVFGVAVAVLFVAALLFAVWTWMERFKWPLVIYLLAAAVTMLTIFGADDSVGKLPRLGGVVFMMHVGFYIIERYLIAWSSPMIRISAPVLWMCYSSSLILMSLPFILP